MTEKVPPSRGGCWFCCTDDSRDAWLFSWEWDAYYHISCLKAAYLKGDQEARVIVDNEYDDDEFKRFIGGERLPHPEEE